VARLTGTGPVPDGLYLLAHHDVPGSRAASAGGGGRQRPQWPNATCLVLAPLPTAVSCARLLLKTINLGLKVRMSPQVSGALGTLRVNGGCCRQAAARRS